MKKNPRKRPGIFPSLPPLAAKRGLYQDFQEAARRLGWRRSGEPGLLGLSGGRDSVALLHLLLLCGHRVTAAHLNHQLRGRESEADEQMVRQLCRAWDVPLVVARMDVRRLAARHGMGLEEAARVARYRFLHRVAVARGLRRVLVAHHERDQAETVLLKLFQGASPAKLGGMQERRPLPRLDWGRKERGLSKAKIELARPLLRSSFDEVARYARIHHLPFHEDRSNRDLAHTRNWIRHRLLPLIERRLKRNITRTLARLGEGS